MSAATTTKVLVAATKVLLWQLLHAMRSSGARCNRPHSPATQASASCHPGTAGRLAGRCRTCAHALAPGIHHKRVID